jgi:hypothetical protein
MQLLGHSIFESRLNGYSDWNDKISHDYTINQMIQIVLDFVDEQNNDFKKLYASLYIEDCTKAYEGSGDEAMSCLKGVIERFIESLKPACLSNESEKCAKIIEIFNNDPDKRIKRYIKEWYDIHNKTTGSKKFENYDDDSETEINKRAESLKRFLKDKFRTEFGISDEIDKKINKKVQEYKDGGLLEGYYFEIQQTEIIGGKKKRKRKTKKRLNKFI